MPKHKTPLRRSIGKLISAVQKVAIGQMGETNAEFSLDVLDAAHALAEADGAELVEVLNGRSIRQHLGELWVRRFPEVEAAIRAVEEALQQELSSSAQPTSERLP